MLFAAQSPLPSRRPGSRQLIPLASTANAFQRASMSTQQIESSLPDSGCDCPCGSSKPMADCCGPILAGKRSAATAEELMRARFTAHVRHDFAFLQRTYRPTAHEPYVPGAEGPPSTRWIRLAVHSHAAGRTPDLAYVDFSAYGLENGAEVVLHENAEFVRENGEWMYTRALREGPAPFRKAAAEPGRNDPCPCGSGKKYKQCCLGKG
jgi:SEC-C motif-containing protein